jgi:GNAT superfamily N-acetyltransferase
VNKKSPDKPTFRQLQRDDIEVFGDLHFPWSTRQETVEKWARYFEKQAKGTRIACVVQQGGQIVGYGHLLRHSEYPSFSSNNIPEINDVWVYEEHRKKGIGALLIAYLEKLAKQEGYTTVGIGVGLYQDYGAAQRLYFRLGYHPDGKGITYKHSPVIPGESYPADDDLILWLVKRLLS